MPAHIAIIQEKVRDPEKLAALCPFGAIESSNGKLEINAGCRMCRICVKNGGGAFVLTEDDSEPKIDKSQWRGVAVVAELVEGRIHPVTFELLGKAREMAAKVGQPTLCLLIGHNVGTLTADLLAYGADEVVCCDAPELENFLIEPYTNALTAFINFRHPAVVLVGGTQSGRSLAPRAAARFRTGLTADCTFLDISPNTDLEQIRPAYGGNIMAHIGTPNRRPQFATVRYKIFPIPEKRAPQGNVTTLHLPPEQLKSAVAILETIEKNRETGIEEADVLIVAGRGVKRPEDLAMLERLAALLNGRLASTRALVEAGWCDPKMQIGLSGRTVKPKLIVTCGVSGAIQFAAGMNGSELIVAINSDPEAPIFQIADVAIIDDLYRVIPELIAKIEKGAVEK